MTLTVGDKIVYPSQGPCLIGTVVQKTINDSNQMFYQLTVLSEGSDLFIPVDKINSLGIRFLLEKSEIPPLFAHLRKPVSVILEWKERKAKQQKLFSSGSAFDLAELIQSLALVSKTKGLSYEGQKTLNKAKSLLICEIAEVMDKTKKEIEEWVEEALQLETTEGAKMPEGRKTFRHKSL